MKKREFRETLLAAGFIPRELNTCNAWGFGGARGTDYKLGPFQVLLCRTYYRHARPGTPRVALYDGRDIDGGCVGDVVKGTDTGTKREKILDYLEGAGIPVRELFRKEKIRRRHEAIRREYQRQQAEAARPRQLELGL